MKIIRVHINDNPGYIQPCRTIEPKCKTYFEIKKRKICCMCKFFVEFKRDDITNFMCGCHRDPKKIFEVQPGMKGCEYFEEASE